MSDRIYVVASKFAPHAGGTAVVWTQWCAHWPPENLTVIAPKIPGCQDFDKRQAYTILRCGYPNIPKIRMPWLWIHQAGRLLQLCLRQRPQILHLSHVFENGFMGPLLKRWLGIPYFVHTYGEELQFALRYPWLRRLVSRVLQQAQGVTTISRYTESLLAQFGYHKPPLLVHPAVDTLRYQPGPGQNLAQQKWQIPPGPLLLTTGRLMERKGHDTVIGLMPKLLQCFPDLQYAIAGVGPYESRLKQLTQELGLQNQVHFLGRVSDEELPILMREATLFVHPNRVTPSGDVEGFGIVFLEAAASGIPVIGGRNGGVPDAVHEGVNGILVESPHELLAPLNRLLRDENERTRMGQAGVAWSQDFTWKAAADKVLVYCQSGLKADCQHHSPR